MVAFNNRIGEVKRNNHNSLMKIVEYNGCMNITVKFKTGSIIKTNYENFKKGQVKDPLFPSLFNVGCFGIGKYKAYEQRHTKTIEYQTWCNMLKRCYAPYELNRLPTYRNITVCNEWLNFQNFAKWHQENYYEIPYEIMNLDKDLTQKDNKQYCPAMCNFIPISINNLLLQHDNVTGKCLSGVIFTQKNNRKYKAQITMCGKNKHIGSFYTEIEAFEAYKKAKKKYVQIMANGYKQDLPIKVYQYLMNYTVKITD